MRQHAVIALLFCAALAVASCTHNGMAKAAPELKDMKPATAGQKVGAPVDVRYSIQGAVAGGRATPVALAIVPRMAGALAVEFAGTDGMTVTAAAPAHEAGAVSAGSVLRYAIEATPRRSAGGMLQVIVAMDVDGGRYISVFNIPLGAASE